MAPKSIKATQTAATTAFPKNKHQNSSSAVVVCAETTAPSTKEESTSFSVSTVNRLIHLSMQGVTKTSFNMKPHKKYGKIGMSDEVSTVAETSTNIEPTSRSVALPYLLSTINRVMKLGRSGITRICIDTNVDHIKENRNLSASSSICLKYENKTIHKTDPSLALTKVVKSLMCPNHLQQTNHLQANDPAKLTANDIKMDYSSSVSSSTSVKYEDKVKSNTDPSFVTTDVAKSLVCPNYIEQTLSKVSVKSKVNQKRKYHSFSAATSTSVKYENKIKSETDPSLITTEVAKSLTCPIYVQPTLSTVPAKRKQWSMKKAKRIYNWKYFMMAMDLSLTDKIKRIQQNIPYTCKIAPAFTLTNLQRREETRNLLMMANSEYVQFLKATKQRNLLLYELHEDFKSLRRLMVSTDAKFENILKVLFEVDNGPYYSVNLKTP